VTEEHVEQESRPDKRVYAITAGGRNRLTDWVNSSAFEQDVFKSTLMLRVFLGQSASPGALINLLQQNVDFEYDRLVELKGMEQRCVESGGDMVFSLLTIRVSIHLTEAAVKWSEESMKSLEAHAAATATTSREEKDAK
jgi:hypothetical protein